MLILTYGISCSVRCTIVQGCCQGLASSLCIRGQSKVQGLTLIFGQRNRHACIRHSSIVIGQPCNIVKLERGFSAVIMGGHSHSKGMGLILLNGFAIQIVDFNGCVLTGGHSKVCSILGDFRAICFLCSNGHSYSAICCIGSRHNTELLSGQLAVIHITRHSRPSVAVITAPLHLAAGRDKGHLVNGIIIGGNTYGKVLYFTGFHSSTIKAGNSNLGRLPGRYSKGRACGCTGNFVAIGINQLCSQGHITSNSICLGYNTEIFTGCNCTGHTIVLINRCPVGAVCIIRILHFAVKVKCHLANCIIVVGNAHCKGLAGFTGLHSIVGGGSNSNVCRCTGRHSKVCRILYANLSALFSYKLHGQGGGTNSGILIGCNPEQRTIQLVNAYLIASQISPTGAVIFVLYCTICELKLHLGCFCVAFGCGNGKGITFRTCLKGFVGIVNGNSGRNDISVHRIKSLSIIIYFCFNISCQPEWCGDTRRSRNSTPTNKFFTSFFRFTNALNLFLRQIYATPSF